MALNDTYIDVAPHTVYQIDMRFTANLACGTLSVELCYLLWRLNLPEVQERIQKRISLHNALT